MHIGIATFFKYHTIILQVHDVSCLEGSTPQWAQVKFSTLNQRWSSTILQLNQNSTRFQPFFNHLEIKVDSQRWFNVESTLRINLSFQGKYGWSSTLIQRWINVEDQPFSHEILGWSSTLIQRWINVEDQLKLQKLRLVFNVDSTLNQRWWSIIFFMKIISTLNFGSRGCTANVGGYRYVSRSWPPFSASHALPRPIHFHLLHVVPIFCSLKCVR